MVITQSGALPQDRASNSPLVLEVLRVATASSSSSDPSRLGTTDAASDNPVKQPSCQPLKQSSQYDRIKVKVVDISGQTRVHLEAPLCTDVATLLAYVEVSAGAKASLLLDGQVLSQTAQLGASGVKDGDSLTLILSQDPESSDLCATWRKQAASCWGCAWQEKHETYVLHSTGEMSYAAVDNQDDGESSTYMSAAGKGKWTLMDDGSLIFAGTQEKSECTSFFSVKRTESLDLRTSLQSFLKDFKRIGPAQ